jgi:hypothetical protein
VNIPVTPRIITKVVIRKPVILMVIAAVISILTTVRAQRRKRRGVSPVTAIKRMVWPGGF